MTGRTRRMEQQRDGKWRYVTRNSSAGCSLDAVREQGATRTTVGSVGSVAIGLPVWQCGLQPGCGEEQGADLC